MRIQTNNKVVGFFVERIVSLLGFKPHHVEFIFEKKIYDDELLRSTFIKQTMEEFTEKSANFIEILVEELEHAKSKETH